MKTLPFRVFSPLLGIIPFKSRLVKVGYTVTILPAMLIQSHHLVTSYPTDKVEFVGSVRQGCC